MGNIPVLRPRQVVAVPFHEGRDISPALLVDEVAVIRDVRAAEAQLDAGMGIAHEVVEKRLRERYLK